MPKEKLTLSVDKEVVEKAKKLGINISEITESILKGWTSAEKPNGSIYDAYRQLFDAITPLLKEFGRQVKVGEGIEFEQSQDEKGELYDQDVPFDIFLDPDGSFFIEPFEGRISDIRKIDQRDFLPPEMILSSLVSVLVKSKEVNKEKMRQIMMAKRIVDAMSDTLIKKPSPRRREKG